MKRARTLLFSIVLAGCLPDPVHDRAVERLGPETANGPSSFHRAGQPCTTCHSTEGPAKSDFSIAGTVFATDRRLVGVDDVTIELVDAAGTSPPASKRVRTNCVGNFWVSRAEWNPIFPVKVAIEKGGVRRTMISSIGHSASCADCHVARHPSPLVDVGAVTLFPGGADDSVQPTPNCPVNPDQGAP